MSLTKSYDLQAGRAIDLDATFVRLMEDYPNGNPEQPSALRRYADLLRQLYDEGNGLHTDFLDQCITFGQIAAQKVPPEHPDRAAIFSNLSQDLCCRFDRNDSTSTEDIDEAIRLAHEAVSIPGSSDRQVERRSNLSSLLATRYQKTKDSRDLNESIRILDKARSEATVHGKISLSFLSHNQSINFGLRFLKTEETGDLNTAIELGREAANSPLESGFRALHQSSLCIWLRLRYERLHLQDDMHESLAVGEAAHSASPDDANAINNLGDALQARYKMTSNPKDLEYAIELGQKALDVTPMDHAMRATALVNIASRLKLRFETEGEPEGLEKAIEYFLQCLYLPSGLPLVRVEAGKIVGVLLLELKRWAEAGKALADAVKLLPRISPRSLPRTDQQYLLDQLSDLSSLAASALLKAGSPAEDALSIFEAGRGIIARTLMDFRSDVSELERIHPIIATRYQELRSRLSPSLPELQSTFNGSTESCSLLGNHHDAALSTSPGSDKVSLRLADFDRLDKVEAEIRCLNGFEHFQLPLPSSDLKKLAKDGPIVCFNVTKFGSHALFIVEDRIRSVELLTLQFETLEKYMEQMIGRTKITRGLFSTLWDRNCKMRKILAWLWKVAVSPVLQDLGLISDPPAENLPRIWWIASGILGLAPIHAAGIYDSEEESRENTSHYVISSYIPSLKALEFSRRRELKRLDQNVLVINVPSTPGYNDLSTLNELEAIKKSIKPTEPTVPPIPQKDQVVEALRTCKIVHFACHGVHDPVDPSKGGLLLPDAVGAVDCLTVQELASSSHDHAQIAYLSACSTAENSSQGLLDEVIHVASAFQLSGFPHVIGSLWESDDEAAVQVTENFYPALMNTSRDCSHRAVAEAVHKALKTLRESCSENFIMWAPVIHLGP